MKLSVKNFGPIGEAKDIRLSPMTLFVGPSNTGKSYLAMLLYAIVESLQAGRAVWKEETPIGGILGSMSDSDAPISAQTKRLAKEKIKKWLFDWANVLSRAWYTKMIYCFGTEAGGFLDDKNFSAILRSDDGAISVDLSSPKKSAISPRLCAAMTDKLLELARRRKSMDAKHFHRSHVPVFDSDFVNALWNEAPGDAYYLPAIRGGVMQNQRGMTSRAVEEAAFPRISPHLTVSVPGGSAQSEPMFNGVLSDFVQKLIRISDDNRRTPPHLAIYLRERGNRKNIAAIGERMECDMMGGAIIIRANEVGYPIYRYKFPAKGKGRELSLKNSSSMVSELAPISVFARHHLASGDLFIVEEPETNLHPDGQRAVSDILAQLANAGVFVLATTHSGIVLEQIGNAVRRAELKNGKSSSVCAKKNGGVSLNESDVSAYSFDGRVRGKTKVGNVKFDPVESFMTDDHMKASTKLYNDTVDLLNGANDS